MNTAYQGVEDFEAVDIRFYTQNFGGLQRSSHPMSLLDGSMQIDGGFVSTSLGGYYAIGTSDTNYRWGPSSHNAESQVELYVLGQGKCTSCSDGVLNGDETSVDCGGTRCSAAMEMLHEFARL